MQLPMTTSYQWWYCVGGKATSGSVCALEGTVRRGSGTHLVDGERAGDEEGAELQASREKSQMLSMQAGDGCVPKLKDGKSGSREAARALDDGHGRAAVRDLREAQRRQASSRTA